MKTLQHLQGCLPLPLGEAKSGWAHVLRKYQINCQSGHCRPLTVGETVIQKILRQKLRVAWKESASGPIVRYPCFLCWSDVSPHGFRWHRPLNFTPKGRMSAPQSTCFVLMFKKQANSFLLNSINAVELG